VDDAREREAWQSCERFVAGWDPRDRDPRTMLLELAERAPDIGDADRYGKGTLAERLEERIAGLLGKEASPRARAPGSGRTSSRRPIPRSPRPR
jgi:hypothetical protein